MSEFLYVSPQVLNLLARGTTTLSTGTANSLFPLPNVYCGQPSKPLILSAAGSFSIDVDGDLTRGYGAIEGTFAGGVAPGWTNNSTGTGAPSEEGAIVNGGGSTKSQQLTSGASGVASVYYDILVRAGEELSITAALRGDGTATIYARAMDLTTGKMWDGSAWQAATSSWASRSTATFATSTDTITADTAANLRAGLTVIRLYFVVDSSVAAGDGYFDDVAIWPSVDFCGIFGHNLPLGLTIQFRSSTSSSWGSPTTQATMSPYQPSFFSVLAAPVAERYWRIRVVDTAITDAVRYIGEAVIGSTVTLTKSVDYPLETTRAHRHTRLEGPLGHVFVGQRSARPTRVLPLTWGVMAASSLREIRDQLYLAAMGDLHSLIVIPRDDDPELCIYGRLQDEYRDGVAVVDYRTTGLAIVEHPFPVVGV